MKASEIVDYIYLEIQSDVSTVEGPVKILNRGEQIVGGKVFPL